MTQAIIQQIETDVTCTWMFEMNNLYVDVWNEYLSDDIVIYRNT